MTKLSPHTNPRDIVHFLQFRSAHAGDDFSIGQLLCRAFVDTYARKLPHVATNAERRAELMDVHARRRSGFVGVLDLGYRIVGTFALILPDVPLSQAWIPRATNLRCLALDPDFHGLGLSDLLVSEALRMANSWNCQDICLHVQDGAGGVARLYERHGWQRDESGDMFSAGNKILGYRKKLLGHVART